MPDRDDNLIARLNALKPSSINLGSSSSPSINVEVNKPESVEDKLAARLKGLRFAGTGPVVKNGSNSDTADSLEARVRDEVSSEHQSLDSDPIRDWHQEGNDEPSLEDLLAELGPDEGWQLDPDDSKNINSLLKEAKEALPKEQEPRGAQAESGNERSNDVSSPHVERNQGSGDYNHENDQKKEEQQDDEDADDYVSRLLAELEEEKRYGNDEQENDAQDGRDEPSNLTMILPSTPSKLPEQSQPDPPSYEDSELEARFSKLGGLNLPSTPNTIPAAKAKVSKKSNLPTYTDEDIDSWCCICNEDGEVKCLGCDNDIYCQKCWREGHGNGPSQERGHRAVQFVRKGGAAAA